MSDFENMLVVMKSNGISFEDLDDNDRRIYLSLEQKHKEELKSKREKQFLLTGLPKRFLNESPSTSVDRFIQLIFKYTSKWEKDGLCLVFEGNYVRHYVAFVFLVKFYSQFEKVFYVESESLGSFDKQSLLEFPTLAVCCSDELSSKSETFLTDILWYRWKNQKMNLLLTPLSNTFSKGGSSLRDTMCLLKMEVINGL